MLRPCWLLSTPLTVVGDWPMISSRQATDPFHEREENRTWLGPITILVGLRGEIWSPRHSGARLEIQEIYLFGAVFFIFHDGGVVETERKKHPFGDLIGQRSAATNHFNFT